MRKKLLEYDFPSDLKKMTIKELELLTYDIRDFLIEKVSKMGGHIASNLGVVELTIALHYAFDSPRDKIIWDVGHQCYVHKILTGRADRFDTLRALNGLSGFPKRNESEHDMHDSGHASTSISIGMGYATARDLHGEDYHVIPVIGDGALTGGVALEALNSAGTAGSKMIVVLNDNEMSIDPNNGSISQHLAKLRASHGYLEFKKYLKKTLKGIPKVGEGICSGMEHIRDSVKYAIVPGAIFEELGFKYLGPVDGHNIQDLLDIFNIAKMIEDPVLIHVVTKKGRGYRNAETNPSKFHGVSPFDPTTGNPLDRYKNPTYSEIFGNKLIQLARDNPKIVAISAAMIDATGLRKFQEKFPYRTFDVGIAEQHAVAFAAGLALGGFRPVVAIYSTFLQRSYDQIIADVCLQNLPVIFMVDRAGNVGSDGETHHGVFDLSYLSHMPGMMIMSPKDGKELVDMLDHAITLEGPCVIRYPRGEAIELPSSENQNIAKSEILKEGNDVSIIAVGKMVKTALEAADMLEQSGYQAEVINARFIKPLDIDTIISSIKKTKKLVTIEDNSVIGGFGSNVLSLLSTMNIEGVKTLCLGWPDRFIQQGNTEELFKLHGLDASSISERVCNFIEGKA
ncbi:MAG: 1-deoxy-D-xylulose-5-phosphate synthase [Clostridiales bacterium]|nr:1-deoxy-D-xylulose-5-phosphate synthase [Clostridiales bacterium]